MSPARRRAAVEHLVGTFGVSQRRACRVVGQHRSTQRYEAVPDDVEQRLVEEMRTLAERHPRYGYRRVHALLVGQGWAVNEKRVERLWAAEGLQVPPRRAGVSGTRAGKTGEFSAQKLPSLRPDHVWCYDFAAARLASGTPFRVLPVLDEYTRRCYGADVQLSIGAVAIEEFLEDVFDRHGRPDLLRADNGREFVADRLHRWLEGQGVQAIHIDKGCPQQNPFAERFVGTLRDEVLDREVFTSLIEARVVITAFIDEYNTLRPHRGLGMKTPAAFAAYCAEHPPIDGQCP